MRLVQRGALIIEEIKNRKEPDGIKYPLVIEFQFNPETLKRTLKIVTPQETLGGNAKEENRHADPRDLKSDSYIGETITVTARFDGKTGYGNDTSKSKYNAFNGNILPVLAIIEKLMDPVETTTSDASKSNLNPPKILPLIFFWWSEKRILPVKITQISINETEFGPELYPIRAEMDLEMEVLVKGTNSDQKIVNAYNYTRKIKSEDAKRFAEKFSGISKAQFFNVVHPGE